MQTAPTRRPSGPTPRPSPPVQIERGFRPGRQPPSQHRPPPGLPKLGDWSRGQHGPDRDQAGRQWRQDHRGWDSSAPWRRDSEWWRRSDAFRTFHGPRIGYFFVPAFGYVLVPPQYERNYWIPGQYLPNWFWQYTVTDYWAYGLPTPPPGCAWVWVDNDVALIYTSDGYILDIVHNVW